MTRAGSSPPTGLIATTVRCPPRTPEISWRRERTTPTTASTVTTTSTEVAEPAMTNGRRAGGCSLTSDRQRVSRHASLKHSTGRYLRGRASGISLTANLRSRFSGARSRARKRLLGKSGLLDLNKRAFGPQPTRGCCRCVLERPCVPIVHGRGRSGCIGCSSRYQSGTTAVAASNRGPDMSLATTHGEWNEHAYRPDRGLPLIVEAVARSPATWPRAPNSLPTKPTLGRLHGMKVLSWNVQRRTGSSLADHAGPWSQESPAPLATVASREDRRRGALCLSNQGQSRRYAN